MCYRTLVLPCKANSKSIVTFLYVLTFPDSINTRTLRFRLKRLLHLPLAML